MTNKVQVIRIGHRIARDIRVTTHCALTARALGAEGITICGDEDKKQIDGARKTADRWGGTFYITYSGAFKKPLSAAKKAGYKIVHATMYGMPIQKKIRELRKHKKLAIIVGSQKVPSEVYRQADYNIAVTNQPHSEVAALAILLHEIFQGKELEKKFSNAKIIVKPTEHGKTVFKKEKKPK